MKYFYTIAFLISTLSFFSSCRDSESSKDAFYQKEKGSFFENLSKIKEIESLKDKLKKKQQKLAEFQSTFAHTSEQLTPTIESQQTRSRELIREISELQASIAGLTDKYNDAVEAKKKLKEQLTTKKSS